MPLNARSAAASSALCAVLLYVGAFGHEWASDDVSIIQNNPAAHSVGNALGAWFEPYWPLELTQSGQYRPLTILSFALDWQMFGDRPGMFHVVNAAWHGVATALFVFVLLAWVTPAAALVGGLVFAVHPVHVEAVANVVGRAELMVAAGLLGVMLLGRRYRQASNGTGYLVAVLGLLAAALFAKEHAVVAVAVLGVDEWLCDGRIRRRNAPLYLGTIAVTLAWLFLFRAIAAEYVDVAVAATIRGLTPVERLATMFPVQLEVVRLLAWPFTLAADYNPLVILRRTDWSVIASLGGLTSGSIIGLSILGVRRFPAVSFGLLLGVIAYAPTSNILFPSGIILSERNLYLAAAAPAAAVAWLLGERMRDRWAAVAVGVVLIGLAGRSVMRVPFWRDGQTVLIDDYAEHPDNYRAHLRLAGLMRRTGDLPGALAETLTAGAIFPEDPWVVQYALVRALDLGMTGIALREAERGYAAEPAHPSFARFLVRAHLARGRPVMALPVARRSVVDAPESLLAAESYVQVLDSLGIDSWQRDLAEVRVSWIKRELSGATALIAEVGRDVRGGDCWDVEHGREIARALLGAENHMVCRSGS